MTVEHDADVTDDEQTRADEPVDADGASESDSADAADVTDEADEPDTETAAKVRKPRRRLRPRWLRGVSSTWGWVALVAVLLAAAGSTAWLYFSQYRTDQASDSAAAKTALQAANDGCIAILSYSPESLDKDFANAKSHLTGDFLNYYTQFTQEIVTPAAKQKQVKTAASVVRSAVSDIKPESATVLVFVNQVTVSKENPDGAFAASSVKVGLTKIDGRWLISSFDPV